MNKYILLLIGFTVLTSCKKEEMDGQDKIKPIITFSTQIANVSYITGDTIFIKGDVTDNDELKEVSITIFDESNLKKLNYEKAVNSKNFKIDTIYVIQGSEHGMYRMKTLANDRTYNTSEREIYFHINH